MSDGIWVMANLDEHAMKVRSLTMYRLDREGNKNAHIGLYYCRFARVPIFGARIRSKGSCPRIWDFGLTVYRRHLKHSRATDHQWYGIVERHEEGSSRVGCLDELETIGVGGRHGEHWDTENIEWYERAWLGNGSFLLENFNFRREMLSLHKLASRSQLFAVLRLAFGVRQFPTKRIIQAVTRFKRFVGITGDGWEASSAGLLGICGGICGGHISWPPRWAKWMMDQRSIKQKYCPSSIGENFYYPCALKYHVH